jgi:amidophosphoribosyltransferase
MITTHPFEDDKLREECGVFGVAGATDAAAMVALGLHALQHRGQEAAGISSFDGRTFHNHKALGHVAGNFDSEDTMRALKGDSAIGHVRYATTGETALRNVQPLYAELSSRSSIWSRPRATGRCSTSSSTPSSRSKAPIR